MRGKPLAIVIYLTLHPQREFNRQDIGRMVWGAKVEGSALRSVYEACTRINKRVPGLLGSSQARLTLAMPVRCDAQALIDATEGRAAAEDPCLREALLSRYRGDFLAGTVLTEPGTEFEKWVAEMRAELRLRYQALWAVEADAREAAADWPGLETLSRDAKLVSPGWLEPRLRLVRSLRRQGRDELARIEVEQYRLTSGADDAELLAELARGDAPAPQPALAPHGARPTEPAPAARGSAARRAAPVLALIAAAAGIAAAVQGWPPFGRTGPDAPCGPRTARAAYVSEDYQRGARLDPGQHFTKTWRVANRGRCTWDRSFRLVLRSRFHDGGPWTDGALSPSSADIPLISPVPPDSEYEFIVSMVAPPVEGVYEEDWVLYDSNGDIVPVDRSPALVAQIVVPPPQVAACRPGEARALVVARSYTGSHAIAPGAQFTYAWSLRNVGDCEWAPGYRIAPTGERAFRQADSAVALAEATRPGSVPTVAFTAVAPHAPGRYAEGWRFLDDRGTPVRMGGAEALAAEIVVGDAADPRPHATCAGGAERVRFVGETYPDNVVVQPGSAFVKSWTVMNSGRCAWSAGVHLHRISAPRMSAALVQPIGRPVLPTEIHTFQLSMRAPAEAGQHREYWEVHDEVHRAVLVSRSPWVSAIIIVPSPSPSPRPARPE